MIQHQPRSVPTFFMLLALTLSPIRQCECLGQGTTDRSVAEPPAPTDQAMEPMVRVRQAIETSLGAAQEDDVERSLAVIRETFANGCPQKLDIGGFLNSLVGGRSGYENYNRSVIAAAAQGLVQLDSVWRDKSFPPAEVYSTLLSAVMPEAPAGTFWTYDAQVAPGGTRHPTGARLLIEWAVTADMVDELRDHIEARSRSRSHPVAVQLLMELALADDDPMSVSVELKALDELQRKLPALATQQSMLMTVLLAFSNEDTAIEALPLAERMSEKLAPRSVQAGNFRLVAAILKRAARMRFESGQPDQARQNLKNWLVIYRSANATGALGQATVWSQHLTEAAHVFLSGGLLDDALAIAGEAVDLDLSESNVVATGLGAVAAGLHRNLITLDTQERFELLRDWTMPTATRRKLRVLSTLVPGDSPPPVFARALGERPRDDSFPVSGIGDMRGLFCSAWLLVEAARETGALRDLTTELARLAGQDVPNAQFVLTLAHIAADIRESNGAVAGRIGGRITELCKAHAEVVNQPVSEENERSLSNVQDIVLAAACLQHPGLKDMGFELLSLLPEGPHRRDFVTRAFLRRAHAVAIINNQDDARRGVVDAPAYEWWVPTHVEHAASSEGTVPPTWLAHDQHLMCLSGAGLDQLVFRYPLTGTFEFSCDVLEASNRSPGGLAYGGLTWRASHLDQTFQIAGLGGQYAQPVPNPFLPQTRQSLFRRLTLSVTDDALTVSLNGRRVWGEQRTGTTAPRIGLTNSLLHASVFRGVTITGEPVIPREVTLLSGNDHSGWRGEYFGQRVPPRRVKKLSRTRSRTQHCSCGGVEFDISAEDRQRLAENAAGIDPETLRQICVFDPAELLAQDQEPDSSENR